MVRELLALETLETVLKAEALAILLLEMLRESLNKFVAGI
jgi:hypothetical protein